MERFTVIRLNIYKARFPNLHEQVHHMVFPIGQQHGGFGVGILGVRAVAADHLVAALAEEDNQLLLLLLLLKAKICIVLEYYTYINSIDISLGGKKS